MTSTISISIYAVLVTAYAYWVRRKCKTYRRRSEKFRGVIDRIVNECRKKQAP